MRTRLNLALAATLIGSVLAWNLDWVGHGRTQCSIVRCDLGILSVSLHEYAVDHQGNYPASLLQLAVPSPTECYPKNCSTAPKDPWERPYCYEPSADLRNFRLWSYGADGLPGGRDDDEDESIESK